MGIHLNDSLLGLSSSGEDELPTGYVSPTGERSGGEVVSFRHARKHSGADRDIAVVRSRGQSAGTAVDGGV